MLDKTEMPKTLNEFKTECYQRKSNIIRKNWNLENKKD